MALTDPPADYARPGGPWDVRSLADLPLPDVVDGAIRWQAAELSALVDRLAAGLGARGVERSDVVAFHLPNWWEAVALFHACWRLGVAALPVHARTGAAQRRELAARAGARLTLTAAHLDPDPADILVRGDADGFADLAATEPIAAADPIDPAALAVLLATSGSTGRPKLVCHTHRGLHGKAHAMVRAHGLTADDVVLMPAPLAHISGLLNGILLPGRAGMTTVLVDRWDPAEALALVAAEHVSFMIGPPTFFVDLAAAPGFTAEAAASLRLISCGGATVTPQFVADTAAAFGAVVKRTYGSTEAPTVTTSHAGDPAERAATTDGRAVGEVELLLVEPGTQQPAADGTGELLVRGPEICDGYLDPDESAAAFVGAGWFRTGDLARIDGGWLTIVGRASATIIRGGENISPAAVEAACTALAGVRNLAVVGMPDERLGERVALVVEADAAPSLRAVQEACATAGLPRFSWPERVVVVDEMPRLAAGKIDRARAATLASGI